MSAVGAAESLFMESMGNKQSMAVPIGLTSIRQTASISIESLIGKGEMLLPVVLGEHIGNAQLARGMDKSGPNPWPKDPGLEFSRKQAQIAVFMIWDPKEKLRGLVTFAVYDLDNRLVSQTNRKNGLKMNLKPGKRFNTWWQVDVSPLPVGVYRIDVLLDDAIAWRCFFRIVD